MKVKKDFFYIFLREDKKTIKQRLIHLLCFITPVFFAFAGCLISPFVWTIFSDTKTPEWFKFLFTIVFFTIPVIIIFVKTRNANPVMKIRVLDKKSEDSEEEKD